MKTKLAVALLFSGSLVYGQQQTKTLTTNAGAPVADNQDSLTAGENGSALLQDLHLIDKLQTFDRERIPERVVHARGVGALGATTVHQPIRIRDEYRQAGELYRSVSKQDQDDLITNLAGDLSQVTNPDTVLEMVSHFYKADVSYGTRLAQALRLDLQQIEARAAKL